VERPELKSIRCKTERIKSGFDMRQMHIPTRVAILEIQICKHEMLRCGSKGRLLMMVPAALFAMIESCGLLLVRYIIKKTCVIAPEIDLHGTCLQEAAGFGLFECFFACKSGLICEKIACR
jgi:hypothetical protein